MPKKILSFGAFGVFTMLSTQFNDYQSQGLFVSNHSRETPKFSENIKDFCEISGMEYTSISYIPFNQATRINIDKDRIKNWGKNHDFEGKKAREVRDLESSTGEEPLRLQSDTGFSHRLAR